MEKVISLDHSPAESLFNPALFIPARGILANLLLFISVFILSVKPASTQSISDLNAVQLNQYNRGKITISIEQREEVTVRRTAYRATPVTIPDSVNYFWYCTIGDDSTLHEADFFYLVGDTVIADSVNKKMINNLNKRNYGFGMLIGGAALFLYERVEITYLNSESTDDTDGPLSYEEISYPYRWYGIGLAALGSYFAINYYDTVDKKIFPASIAVGLAETYNARLLAKIINDTPKENHPVSSSIHR